MDWADAGNDSQVGGLKNDDRRKRPMVLFERILSRTWSRLVCFLSQEFGCGQPYLGRMRPPPFSVVATRQGETLDQVRSVSAAQLAGLSA